MRLGRVIRPWALAAGLLAGLAGATAAGAGERGWLGFGQLATNDVFANGMDRWRTASHTASLAWGPDWQGHLPERFGDMIELRLGFEIISPEFLNSPPGLIDRPFAGALSLGVHSHFRRGALEFSTGAELVVTGPQTGLDDLQASVHDLIGIPGPSAAVRSAQIGNGVHPRLVIEAGRAYALGGNAELRPFVEARWGVENTIRAGADLTLGRLGGAGEFLVRDHVTGQRYRVIEQAGGGTALVLGADIARVGKSLYLPEPAFRPARDRKRLRAGLHWQGQRGQSGFYGLTWLGEEFAGQPEGQLLGSVAIRFEF